MKKASRETAFCTAASFTLYLRAMSAADTYFPTIFWLQTSRYWSLVERHLLRTASLVSSIACWTLSAWSCWFGGVQLVGDLLELVELAPAARR